MDTLSASRYPTTPLTTTLTLCVVWERSVARRADPDFDWPRALAMTRRPLALLYEA